MNNFRFDISFRVFHPYMNPDDICRKLNMQATHRWYVGEPRKTPKGTSLSGKYSESYCSFRLKQPKNMELAGFLREWNKKLLSSKAFLNQVCNSGGRIEYFIGWYSRENSGEVFDWNLLGELAELKINLTIDFYCV